jgi:hypothetical protein
MVVIDEKLNNIQNSLYKSKFISLSLNKKIENNIKTGEKIHL